MIFNKKAVERRFKKKVHQERRKEEAAAEERLRREREAHEAERLRLRRNLDLVRETLSGVRHDIKELGGEIVSFSRYQAEYMRRNYKPDVEDKVFVGFPEYHKVLFRLPWEKRYFTNFHSIAFAQKDAETLKAYFGKYGQFTAASALGGIRASNGKHYRTGVGSSGLDTRAVELLQDDEQFMTELEREDCCIEVSQRLKDRYEGILMRGDFKKEPIEAFIRVCLMYLTVARI